MKSLLTFFVIFISLCPIAAAGERPNILFIFTDDHAPHSIGAYDGIYKKLNPTPNIDRLASEGVLFRNSFCTNSICGPSRAVILTGKHSHKNGFRKNSDCFNGDQQTFPKLLQQAGYQTALFGKWHLKSDPQGFDQWKVLPGQGQYYHPDFKFRGNKKIVRVDGYCTDIVTQMSVDWLTNERDPNRPFMLMCHHKAPHRTWMPAMRHLHLYDEETIPETPTLFDQHADNASGARYQEMSIDKHMHLNYDLFVDLSPDVDGNAAKNGPLEKEARRNLKRFSPEELRKWRAAYGPKNAALLKANLSGKEFVRWKYQRYMKNYLRCIKAVDEGIGRLMETLNQLGLSENTIVIYSSDQGFFLGDHGWFDKRWMYDESMKMPLIVKWPKVAKGKTINTDLVQNLDYAETFLDMAGAKIPADMQGHSLVPLLKGATPEDWRTALYYHYSSFPSSHMVPRHYGIRTADYKLMNFYQFDEWEFYDLKNDPDELTNKYDDPAYTQTIAKLKKRLEDLRVGYQDDSDVSVKPKEWQKRVRGDRLRHMK
jgi:arylsulfatase A-like enzyme